MVNPSSAERTILQMDKEGHKRYKDLVGISVTNHVHVIVFCDHL